MRIRLDLAHRKAIYQQIVEQIQLQVVRGQLEEGTRLPSVREMALELRINPNTVARAYRELERDGWTVSRQRHGVFVRHRKSGLADAVRREQMEAAIDRLLIISWQLDFDLAATIELLHERAAGRGESRRKEQAK